MPLIVQNCTISFKRFEEMNSIRTRQEFVEKLKLLANLPCRYDGQLSLNQHKTLKPWPNGVASGRKLKTWVYLSLRLARPCVHLHWLAITCAQFGRDEICTEADASFSPFGHPTQVNSSWATFINLLISQWNTEYVCREMFYFATRVYLWGTLSIRLATQRKSLRNINLPLFATTCESVWPRLNGNKNS